MLKNIFSQYEYHDQQDGMVYKQEQYEQEHEQYQEYDQHGNPIHRDDQEIGIKLIHSFDPLVSVDQYPGPERIHFFIPVSGL